MKRDDLIRAIASLGYRFLKHGGNHDIYTNGKRCEMIGRHNDIGDRLAEKIIKRCGGKK